MRSFYCNSVSWGMEFRFAEPNDLKALAAIRGTDDNSESYWFNRISGYYHGTHSPQLALTPRVIIIATDDFRVIGFVAGHLTRRYDFDGELQWIDTIPDYRGRGIATSLFQLLKNWFIEQGTKRICVNCASDNLVALNFYKKNGAVPLNEYWLVWEDIGQGL
ncbi:GNAT superfamily N-acetyltransferase [Mucilaginibacter sp. SG538B]|nr:GNAT superfamily N-acetyltransferase [Mucilaginibacter sp. SG538B]